MNKLFLLSGLVLLRLVVYAQTMVIDPATGLLITPTLAKQTNGLDRIIAQADLIFKGRVISSQAESNAYFPYWGNPHATKFSLITVLKGTVHTNELIFWHNTHGPQAWGGGAKPSWYQLEKGQSYLVFARNLDKEDYIFPAAPDANSRTNECRQLYRDGILRTLDAQPLANFTITNAVWYELNRLLKDTSPSNQLYAIEVLDGMSREGWWQEHGWAPGDFFDRNQVLWALLPSVTDTNEEIACRAINCFATESNAAVDLASFADTLVKVANGSPSSLCRLAAITSLSGIDGEAVSNSLAALLNDADENVRVGAVRLLPRFPKNFAETLLQKKAEDKSANVRSVVADVIGAGKFVHNIPTLAKLFADPVGKTLRYGHMDMEFLKAGINGDSIGDVHRSAGTALVKFSPNQVSDILNSNVDDPGFHVSFVAKLAQGKAEPWLPELTRILESRISHVDNFIKLPSDDPRKYDDPLGDEILVGAYTKCWEDIRQYLAKQSPEALASGKFDRYLDLLEKTVRPYPNAPTFSIEPARWLYELLWTKGLTKRADELYQKYKKSDGWWFDDFKQRGEDAQVNPPVF